MDINQYILQYIINNERTDDLVDFTMYTLSLDDTLQKKLFDTILKSAKLWSQFEFYRIVSILKFFIQARDEDDIAYKKFSLAYNFLLRIIFLNENYSYVKVSNFVDVLKELDPSENLLLSIIDSSTPNNVHSTRICVASLDSWSGHGLNLNQESAFSQLLYEENLVQGIKLFQEDQKLIQLVRNIITDKNPNIPLRFSALIKEWLTENN